MSKKKIIFVTIIVLVLCACISLPLISKSSAIKATEKEIETTNAVTEDLSLSFEERQRVSLNLMQEQNTKNPTDEKLAFLNDYESTMPVTIEDIPDEVWTNKKMLDDAIMTISATSTTDESSYVFVGDFYLLDISYPNIIRIPNGYQPTYEEWELLSSDDYLYTLFTVAAKQQGWTDTAIAGTLSYIMTEGRNWGFYTYENYWSLPDPSGHSYPFSHTDINWTPVFDNNAWLNWLSPATIKNANENGYITAGLGAGGILSQSDLFSYSNGTYTKWATGATELIMRADSLGLDLHDPVFQVSLAIETIEGTVSFKDLNNSSIVEYDRNIGHNDWESPKTFSGTAEEYAKIICATIGHSGAYIDASGEIQAFPYASHWSQNVLESAWYYVGSSEPSYSEPAFAEEEIDESPDEATNYEEEDSNDNASSSWAGSVLTPASGVNWGPTGFETYYNLDMSGLISAMNHGWAYTDCINKDIIDNILATSGYWVRDDGVKMFGDYVIVAANLEHFPRGSIVECSLGTAIVLDTGGFASMSDKGWSQLDIAVTW